jgi:type IV pilus assembly protein PilO
MGDALEKFSAIPTAQKFLVLLLALGVVGAGWYFGLIADVEAKVEAANASTRTLNGKLTEAQGKIANIKKFEEEVEALKRQREEMTDRLPADEEIASLLQKIHGQGKIVGLEINRFERQPAEVAQLFVRIPVRMTLTGTFHQIATFFFYVGRLTRIVNVENIALATVASKDGESDGLLTATCTATTFMYRPANMPVDGGK